MGVEKVEGAIIVNPSTSISVVISCKNHHENIIMPCAISPFEERHHDSNLFSLSKRRNV